MEENMEEQQGPRSYVPQPTNQVTIQEGQITYDNELAIDLVKFYSKISASNLPF
jgi:hypothetical protein